MKISDLALTRRGLLGKSADLVAVALSYDKGSHHGLQSPFSEALSRVWVGGMWHVDPTHNTFITTGEGGADPTTAEITLFYNGGKGRYRMKNACCPASRCGSTWGG